MASILKKKIKVAVLGCGKISKHHFEALKNSDAFLITHIAARKNSKRCKSVANKYKIPNIVKDPKDFFHITKNIVDAYVILTSYDVTYRYLNEAISTKKKIFVEKPVSINLKDLFKIKNNKNVFVGFNRRYYSSINFLKKKIVNKKNLSVIAEVPEKTLFGKSNKTNLKRFYSNTLHIIDLILNIFGEIRLKHIEHIKNKKNKVQGIYAIMKTNNASINFIANWNSPSNWSIKVDDLKGLRVLVKPIEELKLLEGTKIIETKKKIKQYLPKIKYKLTSPGYEKKFKPGFVKQYEDFKNFCLNRKNLRPTLLETYKSQKILQKILKLK